MFRFEKVTANFLFLIFLLSCLEIRAEPISASQSNTTSENIKQLQYLKTNAENGSLYAAMEFAKQIKKTNQMEAFKWMRKAAEGGLGEAWYILGNEWPCKLSSCDYLEKAASLNSKDALEEIFDAALYHHQGKPDYSIAKKYLKAAQPKPGESFINNDNPTQYYPSVVEKAQRIESCMLVQKLDIPSSHQPTPSEKSFFFKNKDSCLKYHWGLGVKKDEIKYLKCLQSKEDFSEMFISEVYANGWGVKQNLKLALKQVCINGGAPAEIDGLIDEIVARMSGEVKSEDFSFCNFATSGMYLGVCRKRIEEVEKMKRHLERNKISSSYSKIQRQRFQELIGAAHEFFDKHSVYEIDMTPNWRAMISIEENASQKDTFLSMLQKLESDLWPKDFLYMEEDRKLNLAYKRLMTCKISEERGVGEVQQYNVTETQKLWLNFRDAFAAFGVARFPKSNSKQWKAWLTSIRTKQFEKIPLCEDENEDKDKN
jgi:hypothetical protein